MIKVLIADDNSIVRNGLKSILDQDEEIKVVDCVSNGEDAIKLSGSKGIDLILMDLQMPVCDGIKAIKIIKDLEPSIKIIVLTIFQEEERIAQALYNGADGYVLKDIEPTELISTVKSTYKGLNVVNQSAYHAMIKSLRRSFINEENTDIVNEEIPIKFNETELKVIVLVVEGKTNKEIALGINLSEGRIKNILTDILNKIGVEHRTQLVVYALKHNLTKWI